MLRGNSEMGNNQRKAVSFTPTALEMVKKAISEEGLAGHGLRLAVVGGGCSGFGYAMDFENHNRAGDEFYEIDGLKIYIDFASFQYLQGTEIDFVQGVHGTGFKFNNPNAITKCSCSCGH